MSNTIKFTKDVCRFLPSLPVYEYLVKASIDEVGHKHAVVSTDSFNALAVHLVIGVRLSEEESSVPLLVDQQVWEIDLRTIRKSNFIKPPVHANIKTKPYTIIPQIFVIDFFFVHYI